jgi:hypothetical protein
VPRGDTGEAQGGEDERGDGARSRASQAGRTGQHGVSSIDQVP